MAYAGARAPSMLEELEQEMKLLHWHKLANEAALKAALIRSKRLKAKDNKTMLQESKQQERAVWIQKVLEEEQQKPLEVTDDFVRTHEARESRNREKLAHEVKRHVETLQQLKDSLRAREEEKRRHATYKEKKRALGPPPTRLEDFEAFGGTAGTMATGRTSAASERSDRDAPVAPNLLQSLNRLVELEKRITKLEDADGYDAEATPRSRGDDPVGLKGKAMLFTKKRTVARPGAPAKTVFAVKLVDKSSTAARTRLSGVTPAAQSRTNAASRSWLADRKATQAARKQRMAADYSTARGGAGAFRGPQRTAGSGTSGASSWVGGRASLPARHTPGSSTMPSAGSRSAVAARQLQASRAAVAGPRTANIGSNKLVGRGAAQMNSFHSMRKEFEARKTAAKYGAATRGGMTAAGTGSGIRPGPVSRAAKTAPIPPRRSTTGVKSAWGASASKPPPFVPGQRRR